jgi:glycosyltransferase involved in cell wall biosynthesis
MFVLPARNEAPRVGRVIEEVRRVFPGVPVVVVENGSGDDTAAVARRAGAAVLHSQPGYARALHVGFRHALDAGADWVVQMDADEQHPADAVPALLAALLDADVVVGSRFLAAPGYRVTRSRRTANAVLAAVASVCAGQHLSDVTSGLRAWRPEALRRLVSDWPEDVADGNLLVRAVRRGLRVCELSVPMRERSGGRSQHAGAAGVVFAARTLVLTAREGLGSPSRR